MRELTHFTPMSRAQAKHWIFTLNNPVLSPADVLRILAEHCSYAVFQLELSSSGTPHYQGYGAFKKPQRRTAVSKLLSRASWQVCRSPMIQIAYCQKEDTRTDGPWSHGIAPKNTQGHRSDIDRLVLEAKAQPIFEDLARSFPSFALRYKSGLRFIHELYAHPRQVPAVVNLILGPPGTGKTEYLQGRFPKAYKHPHGSKWFTTYSGQDTIIMDEFEGSFPLNNLLQLWDPLPAIQETKGGHVNVNAATFWLTANMHPASWYCWQSRMPKYAALVRRISNLYTMNSSYELVALPHSVLDDQGPLEGDCKHCTANKCTVYPM